MLAQTAQFTFGTFAALGGIGAAAGILGGLLGIGGGLVMIPSMILLLGEHAFGLGSIHLYKFAALISATVLSLPAVRQHARAGAIARSILPGILLFSLFGVAIGIYAGGLFTGDATHILRRVFGGFMITVVLGTSVLRRLAGHFECTRCPMGAQWLRIGALVGLPPGLMGGLLGIGGGVWAVPVQNLTLGIRLQSAIANSACMIAVLSIAAAIGQGITVHRMAELSVRDGLLLATVLAPGALIGGWIGGGLTHRVPTVLLRRTFEILLIVVGLKLLTG